MTSLSRWLRFNAVGALGMAVQLVALTLLDRCWGAHHLLASAAATECAILHNFALHLRFTWPEQRRGSGLLAEMLGRLVAFHASNGLVSLIGNLVLVRVLVDSHRVPLLAANLVAIATCALLNYTLASRWVFQSSRPPRIAPG